MCIGSKMFDLLGYSNLCLGERPFQKVVQVLLMVKKRTFSHCVAILLTESLMGETSKVKIKVLFFAKSRELAGLDQTYLQVPFGRLNGDELLNLIIDSFPTLSILKENLLLSVNQEYFERNQSIIISGEEEVAVIPPISGG